MAQLNFDASQVAPSEGRPNPVPENWYNLIADESEIKPAANNPNNAYLKVRFAVMDGEFAGRKIFKNFNIKNDNPVAQQIGYSELSALAHAVGVLLVQDSQQLHGIPFKGHVKVRAGQPKNPQDPNGEKYDPQNEIVTFKNVNDPAAQTSVVSAAPSGFTPPAPAAAPAAGGVPWAKPPGAAPAAVPPAMPAQPWAQPAAAAPAAPPPPPPPPAPVAAAFPPAGWTAHPSSPGYYYQGQEVLDEAALRARIAPPAAPPAPPAPPAAPAAPAAVPAAAPAVAQTMAPPWARPPA